MVISDRKGQKAPWLIGTLIFIVGENNPKMEEVKDMVDVSIIMLFLSIAIFSGI